MISYKGRRIVAIPPASTTSVTLELQILNYHNGRLLSVHHCFLLKIRPEAPVNQLKLIQAVAYIANQTCNQPKRLVDNAAEYVDKLVNNFCKKQGILLDA